MLYEKKIDVGNVNKGLLQISRSSLYFPTEKKRKRKKIREFFWAKVRYPWKQRKIVPLSFFTGTSVKIETRGVKFAS